jgi:hypothetical protein
MWAIAEAAQCLLEPRFRASTERPVRTHGDDLGRRGALDCGCRFSGAKRLSAAHEFADDRLSSHWATAVGRTLTRSRDVSCKGLLGGQCRSTTRAAGKWSGSPPRSSRSASCPPAEQAIATTSKAAPPNAGAKRARVRDIEVRRARRIACGDAPGAVARRSRSGTQGARYPKELVGPVRGSVGTAGRWSAS